jgi:Rrf2 family transcriptional regulator, iron-sulfur cluster assembly transcription factor
MLNQTADYALRATLYMAHNGADRSYKATAVANALGLPANYLSKIMYELVRARVLTSVRGPAGGYTLAVEPARLSIDRIVAPFQDLEPRRKCLMGNRRCDMRNPCIAHRHWSEVKNNFISTLQNTTLATLLAPMPND